MDKAEETDKLMQVLDATEHPEKYSDEQLRQLLSDGECGEYYRLMVDAASSYANNLPEVNVDAEWEHFRRKHYPTGKAWRKVAAIIIGILMMSGLSLAAVRFIGSRSESTQAEPVPESNVSFRQQQAFTDEADTVYSFKDAELQEILSALTTHYQLHTEYRNDQARHVRLYIKWNKTETVQTMVESLNRFEKVNIKLADGLLIVE